MKDSQETSQELSESSAFHCPACQASIDYGIKRCPSCQTAIFIVICLKLFGMIARLRCSNKATQFTTITNLTIN